MKIKKNIYNFINKIFLIFFKIFLKLNFSTLITLLIYLSLHRSKKINNPKKYNKIKIIINKSAGISDVEQALSKRKINNKYLILERKYLILIQEFFLKKKIYDFDLFNDKITNSANFYKYEKFLNNILKKLKVIIGNYSFFSFNFSYGDEFVLHKLCNQNSINFSVIHKESILSPAQIKAKTLIFKKLIKFPLNNITKIFVYNKFTSDLLIQNNVFKKNQIIIGGCTRALVSKVIRNTKEQNILYFFTDDYAGKINHLERLILKFKITKLSIDLKKSKKLKLNIINNDVIKLFDVLSEKYSNVNFIIKVKSGNTVKAAKLIQKKFKNKKLKFFYGGAGHDFIPEAKVVIGLNTTAVFESLNASKTTIIPLRKNFLNKKNKYFFYKYPKKNIVIGYNNLKKTIESLINKNKKIKLNNKKLVKYYLGDINKSSNMLFNFLEKY